jgi:predicted TIM-barrel fold metal-dependent hydrolase
VGTPGDTECIFICLPPGARCPCFIKEMNVPSQRIDAHNHMKLEKCEGDPKAHVEMYRALGIQKITVIAPLEECRAAMEKFGDFVIPCPRIDMDDCSSREIEEIIKSGCNAIKFIRPAAPYGDERYWKLYEKMESLGKTAVFHTGYLGGHKREDRPVHMEHMRAAQIEVVSRRFPDLKILMSHFSNPWWEEAWKIMWTKPNVYADLSGGTALRRSVAMWAEMFAPEGKLIEAAIRKLVFASDWVHFGGEAPEPWTETMEFYDAIFDRIHLSEDLRDVVNQGNARKLYGLEAPGA